MHGRPSATARYPLKSRRGEDSRGPTVENRGSMAARPDAGRPTLPTRRFRPTIVLTAAPAWRENGGRRLPVGAVLFRAVEGCDRCVLTSVNPDTTQRGKDPIAALARHRKSDGRTWFGMNLIADTPGVPIAIGDDVELSDEISAPDGLPR